MRFLLAQNTSTTRWAPEKLPSLKIIDDDFQSLNFGVHTAWGRPEIGTCGIKSSVRQRSTGTEEFANKEEEEEEDIIMSS